MEGTRGRRDCAEANHSCKSPSSLGRRGRLPGIGCLVVVTGLQLATLDLILTAARRRMPNTEFEFPNRITTRRSSSSDAELVVTRRLFRQIEQEGGFVATWQSDGQRFGLPDSLRKLLLDGRTAVIAAPSEVVDELRGIGADLRVIRLTCRLDAALASLTPRACLRRIVGPRLARRLEARSLAPRTDVIPYAGDIPSAIQALTDRMARLEHELLSLASTPPPQASSQTPTKGIRGRRTSATAAAL